MERMPAPELGASLSKHRGGLTAQPIFGGGLCVLLGLFFVGAAFTGLKNPPLAVLVGLGMLAGGVWMIRGAIAWLRVSVELCERGLVYTVGIEPYVCHWAQVTNVTVRSVRVAGALGLGEIRQKITALTLHTRDGRNLELKPALADFDSLAEKVRSALL
jgi:hypothetical protein